MQGNTQEFQWHQDNQYCELQYRILSIFSIENAERMENCP